MQAAHRGRLWGGSSPQAPCVARQAVCISCARLPAISSKNGSDVGFAPQDVMHSNTGGYEDDREFPLHRWAPGSRVGRPAAGLRPGQPPAGAARPPGQRRRRPGADVAAWVGQVALTAAAAQLAAPAAAPAPWHAAWALPGPAACGTGSGRRPNRPCSWHRPCGPWPAPPGCAAVPAQPLGLGRSRLQPQQPCTRARPQQQERQQRALAPTQPRCTGRAAAAIAGHARAPGHHKALPHPRTLQVLLARR